MFWAYLGTTPAIAEGLLLKLSSGITPGTLGDHMWYHGSNLGKPSIKYWNISPVPRSRSDVGHYMVSEESLGVTPSTTGFGPQTKEKDLF